MNHNKPTYQKNAFILTVVLLLLTLGCLLWLLLGASDTPSSSHLIADIYQDGELIQSISLRDVTDPYTFTIVGTNGCQNEIAVRPGSIRILSADCPDKLCVNQGFISSSLLPITCLPNHLVIQIRTETSVDIVTY